MDQMKYLKELAVRYPNVAAASTEIINLQAILHLPKGTEHYVSDVHGEYEKFSHNAGAMNVVNKKNQVTGLRVHYTGETVLNVKAGTHAFTSENVTATALYQLFIIRSRRWI